jgi:hypothetical protein
MDLIHAFYHYVVVNKNLLAVGFIVGLFVDHIPKKDRVKFFGMMILLVYLGG